MTTDADQSRDPQPVSEPGAQGQQGTRLRVVLLLVSPFSGLLTPRIHFP